MSQTTKTLKQIFNSGGVSYVPPDSRLGDLFRPQTIGDPNGRITTPETYFDFFLDNVPNPDEALALDPNFDTKIRRHPDVQAAWNKRALTVASYPERVEPNPIAPDQKQAKEIAKVVEQIYFNLPKRKKLYQQLQRAVLEGGAGAEFIWQRDVTGFEYPTDWYPVSSSRFLMDRMGNLALLTRANPVWGGLVAPNPNDYTKSLIDDKSLLSLKGLAGKFIYHVHQQYPGLWGKPQLEGYVYYGLGLDVPLYYVITWDYFVLNTRMKWLSKYGDPTFDLYGPSSDTNSLNVAAQIAKTKNSSVCFIPDKMQGQSPEESTWYLKQREVPSPSYDAFERFSDQYTKRRVDALILGSADENQKGETGGYADHVSRKDSGPQILFSYDAANIAETINNQLIIAIANARFPGITSDYIPVFKLEPKEERDRLQEADILTKASGMGLKVSQNEAYEKLGLKLPEEGEDLLEAPEKETKEVNENRKVAGDHE